MRRKFQGSMCERGFGLVRYRWGRGNSFNKKIYIYISVTFYNSKVKVQMIVGVNKFLDNYKKAVTDVFLSYHMDA